MVEVITGGQRPPLLWSPHRLSDLQRLPAPLPHPRPSIYFFLHLLFKIKTPAACGSLMFMPQ